MRPRNSSWVVWSGLHILATIKIYQSKKTFAGEQNEKRATTLRRACVDCHVRAPHICGRDDNHDRVAGTACQSDGGDRPEPFTEHALAILGSARPFDFDCDKL